MEEMKMQVNEMKRIEKAVKYLAEHMDEYNEEEFRAATQQIADDSWENVWDEHFNECTVMHLKNLMSLYRYLKMGMYN